jgi:hypothetical protein
MHPRARDRAHINHAAGDGGELLNQAAGKHQRREEVDLEHRLPILNPRLDGAQPAAPLPLGGDRHIVDERIQLPPCARSRSFISAMARIVLSVAEIDLDVVLGACLPRAILGEGVARARDHPPAGGREALDRGVADAARGTGQDQGPALLIGDVRHGVASRSLAAASLANIGGERVKGRAGSWSRGLAAKRAGTRCGCEAGRVRSSRTRSREARGDSRANRPGAAPLRRRKLG